MKGKIIEMMRDDKYLYHYRKDNMLCVRCGDELTAEDLRCSDKLRCSDCRRKKNADYKFSVTTEARRKAAGLCVTCGRVLIGTERLKPACPACMEKAREKRERKEPGENSYIALKAAAASLEETCGWLVRMVKGINADGMRPQCVNCPWLIRRTQFEVNSYCPSASGTGPDTQDCLKFLCGMARKTKKREEKIE